MFSAGVMQGKPNPQCPAPRGTPLLSCPGGQRGSSRPQQPPKFTPGQLVIAIQGPRSDRWA